MNTHVEHVIKLRMDLTRHALGSRIGVKIHYQTEKTRIGYPWLSQTHPLKSAEVEPVSERST